jgi:hypothetical protein
MNDLIESINYLTAQIARIDTEVLLLILYCLKMISRKKYTPEMYDLYVILEVELAKRAANMGQ